MNDVTRYPLCWPPGRPRTPAGKRSRSKFHTMVRKQSQYDPARTYTEKAGISLGRARDGLIDELYRLGAKDVILSTNLRLRNDGLPYADQRQPDDPGAAVYFRHDGHDMAFACDRWAKVEENLVAITKTIEALRGIERWGTGDMVAAAFTGFQALPAARVANRPWWEVLGVQAHTPTLEVTERYRQLAKNNHPDRGGNQDAAAEINGAWVEFKKERGL